MKLGFLQDENGDRSSKRLFVLILMILWIIYFFSNLYWKLSLKDSLEEYMFYMIIVFFGGVAAEGWKNIFKKTGATPDKTESKVVTKETTTETKKTDG